MVSVVTRDARLALNALDPDDHRTPDEAADALTIQPNYYDTHFDADRETFHRLLADPRSADAPTPDPLADGFAAAAARLDELRDRLDAIEALDVSAVERDVRRYLPGDPDLDATVYVVVDGFNGGFAYDGDVAVSVLHLAPGEVPTKLRHELHHVGVREVRDDDPMASLTSPDDPQTDARDLTATALFEGLAIALAQGGLSVYEEDETAASVVGDYRDREAGLLAELAETLAELAATGDPDRRWELVESVALDPDGVLPPTHFLGARMVEAIAGAFGDQRAVGLVEDVASFLPTYQDAARQSGRPTLPADAVADAVAAVESVEA